LADPFEHIADLADKAEPAESPEADAASVGHETRSSGSSGATIQKIPIIVQPGELHVAASRAGAEMLAAGVDFFQRSGEVVTPIVEEVGAFNGRRTRVARLKPVGIDLMRDKLSSIALFQKFSAKGARVTIDPPSDVVKVILARDSVFRRLAGIITTPTLRPDGSLLQREGYDEATGLLLIGPPNLPPIPEKPTQQDALKALGILDELLNEFSFVDKASRSVALCCLMTPVLRGGMQVAPLHAVTAPAAGSGKTYVIDLASAISAGEIAPVISAGQDEKETEKRLAAELMEGQPIVSIDNLNGELRGDFLAQAIERPLVKPRILGLSKNQLIQNKYTLFANGNNLQTVGDLNRRVVVCSLDANVEQPELRQFKQKPVDMVLNDRGRYIAAILTIAKSYLAAGAPRVCDEIASFGDWTRLVRAPLIWLGRDDPIQTMAKARKDDPELAKLEALVSAWWHLGNHNDLSAAPRRERDHEGRPLDTLMQITAGDLIRAAEPPPGLLQHNEISGEGSSLDQCRRNLLGALSAFAWSKKSRNKEIDPHILGINLRNYKNRIVPITDTSGSRPLMVKIVAEQNKVTKQNEWLLQIANSAAGG
jgi:putative DNA primase/helicase